MPKTPKFPLTFDETTLYETTEDIKEITKFHVKNIVLTNPGENISAPGFGVGARKYLFENLTDQTIAALSSRIRSQIKRYASHVQVLSIKVNPIADDNYMSVKLSYYIPIINESDILSFSISNSTAIY